MMRAEFSPMRVHQSLIIMCFVFVAALLPATHARAIEIQQVTSPGGIKALLVEDYTVPIIAMALSFKGGAVQDLPGKEGTLRLTAALMDEGAGDLDNRAFQARLEETGVEIGFGASRDNFSVHLRTLRSERDNAFELLTLALAQPRFDGDAIERMRDAIKTGIERSRTSPDATASEAMRKAIFKDHVYARRTQGNEQSITAITREDIVAMHRRIIARDTVTLGVVGAINAQELARALDGIFGNLPDKAEIAAVDDVVPELGEKITITMDAPKVVISLVYPGVKRDDPDFFAVHLMNHILGGGSFSSRLYQEVREKRGLAYGVSSSLAAFDRSAFLVAGTSVRPEKFDETLSILRTEIDRMAKQGVTKYELEAARKYVIGAYAINNLDTSTKIARVLVALQSENLGIDYIDKREALISAVTLEDVNRVAKKLLSAEPTIIVVGPATN